MSMRRAASWVQPRHEMRLPRGARTVRGVRVCVMSLPVRFG